MTRIESDKEDLIRDATALVDRAEFSFDSGVSATAGWSVVTAGFRRDRSLSVYFDQDPFYQFDQDGHLRRCYADGFLYRSTGDGLARLNRHRTKDATTLMRDDLSKEDLRRFQDRMKILLTEFSQALTKNSIQMLRVVSEKIDIRESIVSAIDQILRHEERFLSKSIPHRR